MSWAMVVVLALVGILAARGVYEAFIQKTSTLQRNFPLIIHFRYWLELLGPPLRQYVFSGDTEERPYNQNTCSWVYARSKGENNVIGFGSERDHNAPGTVHILPSLFPVNVSEHDGAKQPPPPADSKSVV